MAHRRVIADSDDEDGEGNPPSPDREDIMDPPEVEPLSPHRKPSSSETPGTQNQQSDSTDQSFFASVYDEQQSRAAAQQSQLIEHIIRQSQKASGSSGEISLPAKGKGRKANASSATSVTSPVVLSRPGNQPSLFSEGASNITTPRRSAPGTWDVPSSPEGAKSAKSSRRKNEKSYGKRRRGSKVVSSPAAAKVFMDDDGASEDVIPNPGTPSEMLAPSNPVELPPQPAAKKRRVSLHDSVPQPQETATVANFYIAQSNLTTMQKLEYEKVRVPQNSYPGLPGSLNNPKSSGMTTVAYPTPSRYASSSGPPLPWERSSAADPEHENSNLIDITSSPDVMAAGHDYVKGPAADTTHIETHETLDALELPNEDSTPKGLPKKKGKRRLQNTQDEDELGQDEPWDSDIRKDHKRRRSKQKINSPDLREGGEDIGLIQSPYGEPPGDETHGADESTVDIPATAPPPPTIAPEPSIPEVEPTPQPKKRGRKKKQPMNEGAALEEQISTVQPGEAQPEIDKPKKKRGRPRKSDVEKPETVAAPELEAVFTPKACEDDTQRDELASEKTPTTKGQSKMKKSKKKQTHVQEEIDESGNEQVGDMSPLKEISHNSRTSSQKSTPTDEVPGEADLDQNLPPNQPAAKAVSTPKSTPTPTPSQPKVPYRVGLSKRTRITSLLKSIKR
ncbi:hypothetical protein Hte_003276 [Hypoxylon texense]